MTSNNHNRIPIALLVIAIVALWLGVAFMTTVWQQILMGATAIFHTYLFLNRCHG